MANLATADQVGMLNRTDSILIIQGGKVKRITADKLAEQINQGDEALLRQVAWGIPIKQGIQSDPHWGTCGNWDLYNEYKAKVGRYLVKPDGTAAKLCRTDSSVYADGTPLDETKGNVMVIGPRLYYRVQDDALAGCPVLWMSEQPIGGHWLSNAGEHNCYAAYKGWFTGNKYTSKRIDSPSSPVSKNIRELWAAAQANGSDWGLFDYDGWRWMAMLSMCEAEGYVNIQDALGYGLKGSAGNSDYATALLPIGATSSLGDETGQVPNGADGAPTGSCHVSVCGLEDYWGRENAALQGVFWRAASPTEAIVYKGNRLPTQDELTTAPQGEYRIAAATMTGSGYIANMLIGEYFDLIPQTGAGASATAKWCDYYQKASSANGQLFQFGCGPSPVAVTYGGPFALWNYYGYTNATVSCLAYYGNLKFTDGRNI